MTRLWVPQRLASTFRAFLDSGSSGGLILMAAALAALVIANSPLAPLYFGALHAYVGPLSVSHWINDALMAVFFLLVGLEIKREVIDGQLSTWSRRALPGIAAIGGMAAPALIYASFNWHDAATLKGWAIPSATDIAFALGVMSLLGPRVPISLKVFLTALAIIDDLGAVIIIALFYTTGLSLPDLGIALAIVGLLVALNRFGVTALWLYLLVGAVLWFFVLRSGIHATLAGVALAMTIPLHRKLGWPDDVERSPLHRLEHGLHGLVGFVIVPIFGFANAGVSFAGVPASALVEPLTLGVALGLTLGKLVGVFASAALTIRLGLAELPTHATWTQLFGTALLCGIGFTMSLFISLLAFADSLLVQDEAKLGILMGSLIAGVAGFLVLRLAPQAASRPT